jgi:hypothetical protein
MVALRNVAIGMGMDAVLGSTIEAGSHAMGSFVAASAHGMTMDQFQAILADPDKYIANASDKDQASADIKLFQASQEGAELGISVLAGTLSIGKSTDRRDIKGGNDSKVDDGSVARQDMDASSTSEQGGVVEEVPDGAKATGTAPNFYTSASGETIPATGYRYVSSDAPYLQDLLSHGIIPANSRGTYISFDSLGQGAAGKLQVPHDAAIKIEFDTKQILDDVQIPKGQWGKADYPEPITNDFPQFGPGGATQAVTTKPIVVNKIIDARTGKVLYERGQ